MESPLLSRRTIIAGTVAGVLPRIPAQARQPELPFIVIGDWGRAGAHEQRAVGITTGRAAARTSSRFTVNVGDNFYENGVDSVDDPQWVESFEAIYADPALFTP